MAFNLARSLAASRQSDDAPPMNLTQLPANILETFIPGYSLVSRFMLDVFGFDISVAVSIFALLFAIVAALKYSHKHLYSLGLKHLTASVTMSSEDDIYSQVISWLSEQQVTRNGRSLVVKSGVSSAWDDEDNIAVDTFRKDSESGTLINFSNWEAKVPPRFEPDETSKWFWHRGHCFRVQRHRETTANKRFGLSLLTEEKHLTVVVVGRSTLPIKQLITEARDVALGRERSRTAVRRPANKAIRSRGSYAWTKVTTRPSRPIETVVLDEGRKREVLLDINEYLHPASPRWYANRGIPYRRGYLFHGPPGTGKTSLSFAVAGVFGLNIYCISLQEPSLTEEDLGLLFNSLPRRCVVLLEDIDTAGLDRNIQERELQQGAAKENEKDKTDGTTPSTTKGPEQQAASPTIKRKARKAHGGAGSPDGEESGISLSGLLNAMDGVASHEGRVLVMTTNHPELLDEALIRPGRVDMQVEFTLATRTQMREIFVRMYSPEITTVSLESAERYLTDRLRDADHVSLKDRKPPTTITTTSKQPELKNPPEPSPPDTPPSRDFSSSSESSQGDKPGSATASADTATNMTTDINHLASVFANSLPESAFSPAEIQGFLLTRKREPLRAVTEVAKWCEDTLAARRKGATESASEKSAN